MKVTEKVITQLIHNRVKRDVMRFGFVLGGRGTTDAIFLERDKLLKKYLAKNKTYSLLSLIRSKYLTDYHVQQIL